MSLASRWQESRIRFFRARIDHLIERQKWQHALTTVIDFAQWADGRIDDVDVWLDMTVRATRIVGHLDDPAEYRAFLTHFAEPFLGGEHRPHTELLDAIASIADHVDPPVMISIGRWLADARPDWPLGPYLVGHFRELDDRRRPNVDGAREAENYFHIATERADGLAQRHWSLHCRLRRGALLLSGGIDAGEGRRLLGELDWTGLQAAEQLWMAVALARSGRWTDRMRAMDIVLDLHRETSKARPGASDLRPRDLRRAASAIFRLAGLHLPEPESRRLDELTENLFTGDERRQWRAYLDARERLSQVAALPFDQADRAFATLDELADVHPQRWTPVIERFRILYSGWSGDYDATARVPTPMRDDKRLSVADTVARTLSILDDAESDAADLREHLERIDALLDTAGDQDAALRPLALLWPQLVDAAPRFELRNVESLLTRIARRYTERAPRPGYGWWSLAAHLYDAAIPDAADVVAEHARRAGADFPEDDEVRHFVAATRFRRAVDDRNARDARRWLDHL